MLVHCLCGPELMLSGTLSVEILSPGWRRVPPETSMPAKAHSHDAAFSACSCSHEAHCIPLAPRLWP